LSNFKRKNGENKTKKTLNPKPKKQDSMPMILMEWDGWKDNFENK
jgi:hypothetical protein